MMSSEACKRLSSKGFIRQTKECETPIQANYTENLGPSCGHIAGIRWLHLKYRLVFSLDLTPSMASSLDPISGACLLDNLFPTLQRSFLDLVKPITLPSLGIQVNSAYNM